MSPTKLFIAVRNQPLTEVKLALDGYNLIEARDVPHGELLLKQHRDIDLFLIGVLFDESRGTELIKAIRLDEAFAEVPIIVLRLMHSKHEDMLFNVMTTLKAAKAISEYVEGEITEPGLRPRIRGIIEAHLPLSKRIVVV